MRPTTSTSLATLLLAATLVGCGAEGPSGENNASSDNAMTGNHSGANNTGSNNATGVNQGTADMGQFPGNTANNNVPGNNATTGNTGPGDMGMSEPDMNPPPVANGLDELAPWPKFRANYRQTGQVAFTPTDDGRAPWQFDTGAGVLGTPVVDADETTYVGSGDGTFRALDPLGEQIWRFETAGAITSSGLLDGRGQVIFGSTDGNLYALDRTSGAELWRAQADDRSADGLPARSWQGHVSLDALGDVIAGNDNGTVYTIARDDGAIEGRALLDSSVWSGVAIDIETGDFFLGTNDPTTTPNNVFGYAPGALAAPTWGAATLGSVVAGPMVLPDKLVVASFDGALRALDKRTGAELWRFTSRDHIAASPALEGTQTVVLASTDGTVYGLDQATGQLTWSYDWGAPLRSSPAVDGSGNIFLGTGDGYLISLDDRGQLRWAQRLVDQGLDDLNGAPALTPHAVVIGSQRGTLYQVPYDFCLRPSEANNPDCLVTPGERAPANDVSMTLVSRLGEAVRAAPYSIDAHQALTFRLDVREGGDDRLALLDASALQVTLDPPLAADTIVSADRRFLTLIPQATFTNSATGTLNITITGDYLVDPTRQGLATTGGTRGGAINENWALMVRPPGAEMSFYPFPEQPGQPAGLLQLSSLVLPVPNVLPSYGQVPLAETDLVVGLIEGSGGEGLGWAIQASGSGAPLPEGATFPVAMRFERGRWTLETYDPARASVAGVDVGIQRLRLTAVEAVDGSLPRPAELVGVARCAEIAVWGGLLELLGKCDAAGDLGARGAAAIAPVGSGVQGPPEGWTGATFGVDAAAGELVVTLTESSLEASSRHVSVLLVDEATGRPLPVTDWAARTRRQLDADGDVAAVRFDLTGLPATTARAYLVIDAYPAAVDQVTLP